VLFNSRGILMNPAARVKSSDELAIKSGLEGARTVDKVEFGQRSAGVLACGFKSRLAAFIPARGGFVNGPAKECGKKPLQSALNECKTR